MTIPTPRNSTRLGTRTRTASSDASRPAHSSAPVARMSGPTSIGTATIAGGPVAALCGVGSHAAQRHGRRLHDRRRRLPVGDEDVDDLLQVQDVADVCLEEEAVLAGDPMALDDLWGALGQLGDLSQLARRGPHADDRGKGVAERAR